MKIKNKSTPNCLRKYRKVRGLKQKNVAKILNINSTSVISRWENGICLPSTLNILCLAQLYRTPVEALLIDHVRILKKDIHQKEEKLLKSKSYGDRRN